MTFLKFASIDWPDQAIALFSVSVKDVLAFREQLVGEERGAQNHQPADFVVVQFL